MAFKGSHRKIKTGSPHSPVNRTGGVLNLGSLNSLSQWQITELPVGHKLLNLCYKHLGHMLFNLC